MTEKDARPGEGRRGGTDDQLGSGVGSEDSRLDSLRFDTDPGVVRLWHQAVTRSKQESQERRARVLAHPDLAQRLTEPPLRLSNPQRWSGWVPPARLAEERCKHCAKDTGRPICRGRAHYARVNNSPVRRQLVAIAAEAMAREATGQSAS